MGDICKGKEQIMEVVCSCDTLKGYKEIKGMEGRKFRSFKAALLALKPGQEITLSLPQGYKQVGIDKDGKGWVQKYASPEY